MSKHSAACCKLPPVVSENYTPKGKYIELNGTKTYVTGSDKANIAILSCYDIFGYKPQIVQGADILAHGDTECPFQVFMPDFFNGNPADFAWYPPDTKEKEAKLGEWFKTASPPIHLPKVPEFLEAAEKVNPNIKQWGIIGYCWGGKMASLIAGSPSKFGAAVQTSPAMVDPSDAEKVQIPTMILASKDEPADDIKKYEDKLKVTKHVETFGDDLHGFMSARADFKDPQQKASYERGYKLAVQFFHDNLV